MWLDLGELQSGDAWDAKIRLNVESCSLFLPLVSRETEAREEAYFRREWNLAAERALAFADDVPFILPIAVDDTAPYSARVPERSAAATGPSLPEGSATPEFTAAPEAARARLPSPPEGGRVSVGSLAAPASISRTRGRASTPSAKRTARTSTGATAEAEDLLARVRVRAADGALRALGHRQDLGPERRPLSAVARGRPAAGVRPLRATARRRRCASRS